MPRPPLAWGVYGILPTLGVVLIKRRVSHRDALRYIYDHGGSLSNKYNMTLHAGVLKQDRDWMVSLTEHWRKHGVS